MRAIVTSITSIDEVNKFNLPQTAYYGSDDSYHLKKNKAQEAVKNATSPNSDLVTVDCWVQPPLDPEIGRISLVHVDPPDAPLSTWALTVIATVAGIYLMIIAATYLFDRLTQILDERRAMLHRVAGMDVEGGETGGVQGRLACLNSAQARFVCSVFARDWKPLTDGAGDGADAASHRKRSPPAPDWVCAICLDDSDRQAQGTVRTVQLPCGHRFHRGCIRQWLRRGKPACPLCQWDVRQLFDQSGAPALHVVTTHTPPLQCDADVGDEGQQQQEQQQQQRRRRLNRRDDNGTANATATTAPAILVLDESDCERYTQGLASWQHLQDDESVSSIHTSTAPPLRTDVA